MFKSLNHILSKLEQQPQWEELRQFQRMVTCWQQVVGAKVAKQTRPYSISREILYVATSSSVWAQELKFKRRSILKKLNAELTLQLVDIRFSTAQWEKKQETDEVFKSQSPSLQEHPSHVVETVSLSTVTLEESHPVYQQWVKLMQMRSQQLPLCPNCQCPTPPGELQRWGICCLCAAKNWQH